MMNFNLSLISGNISVLNVSHALASLDLCFIKSLSFVKLDAKHSSQATDVLVIRTLFHNIANQRCRWYFPRICTVSSRVLHTIGRPCIASVSRSIGNRNCCCLCCPRWGIHAVHTECSLSADTGCLRLWSSLCSLLLLIHQLLSPTERN